jgi:general secretion pathway protein K
VIGSRGHQRGFALLIVLWALGLLALLGSQLVAAARERMQVSRNLRNAAQLELAADGALQHTIFELLNEQASHWRPDGAVHTLQIGPVTIAVRVQDEGGKINPNIASVDLLRALLVQLGVDPRRAAGLAAAIADWRTQGSEPQPLGAKAPQYATAGLGYGPPGASFARLDELGLVLGMTPDVLQRLRPHLTLFTEADPDLTTTDPVVALALQSMSDGVAVAAAAAAGGEQVASITAIARGPDESGFGERVIVRTNASTAGGRYEVLQSERLAAGSD